MLDWLSVASIVVTLLLSGSASAGSFSLSYCWKADSPARVEAWIKREELVRTSESVSLRFGLPTVLYLGPDQTYAVTVDYQGKRCIMDFGRSWRNLR